MIILDKQLAIKLYMLFFHNNTKKGRKTKFVVNASFLVLNASFKKIYVRKTTKIGDFHMTKEVLDYLFGVLTGAITIFLIGYFLLEESFSVAIIISAVAFLVLSISSILKFRKYRIKKRKIRFIVLLPNANKNSVTFLCYLQIL
ncbi:hypothetical protein PROCOU_00590 [Listeria rocourtiae FSL F6-920]|nr:hypothetical protein PROCOU_00590 [Listeria rocourtiae FSL F6-920]